MKKSLGAVVGLIVLGGCGSGASSGAQPSASASTPNSTTSAVTTSSPTASASPSASAPTTSQTAVPAEKSPPGDIPDNVAYVPYTNAVGRYSFTHPEGWAETTALTTVSYTDKLNGVKVFPGTDTSPATVATANRRDVPALTHTEPAFELRSVSAVTVPGGRGVRIVYRRNSAPDPVTGRQYRDEVERYELVSVGREVIAEFFGPVGADNVDAYRTMVQSLRIT